jgi:perosamine synthetase
MKFIPISRPSITQKEIDYINNAIRSGWVSSLGKYIDKFEEEFAKYCEVEYALSASSGTTALHLVLASSGIGKDDEVIIPDLTFVATANAVKYTGADVITVDIEESTLCINPKEIEKSINSKTKAIIAVHLYGHPANMDEIKEIAVKYNLLLIEDAAEAHGAEVKGKKVGALGDVAIFSFYGNKIITSGEGGMITTNDKNLYKKMKFLRDHAMSREKRYWHTKIGYNYRMTNLQAALGVAQLERIDEILKKKKNIFLWYKEELNDLEEKGLIQLNYEAEWAKNVYWMICLQIMDFDENKREILMKKLKEKGIDSRPFFYPISDMPMYKKTNTLIAHKIYQRGINLPSYFDLKKDEVIYIAKVLRGLI